MSAAPDLSVVIPAFNVRTCDTRGVLEGHEECDKTPGRVHPVRAVTGRVGRW